VSDPAGEAGAIVAQLREAPADVDGLVRATELPPDRVAAALTQLELDGLVTVRDGIYRPLG
jgi:predicted Rossmann fold nucleotide-binding protein DprA/Smf involved in DNA uptake